jgi:hypothetical protein
MANPIFWRDDYLKERQNSSQLILTYEANQWRERQFKETQDQSSNSFPVITFNSHENELQSPFSASFGGIYLGSDLSINPDELVIELNSYLEKNKVEEVRILLPPSHLSYLDFVEEKTYLDRKWKQSYANVNHIINLNDWSFESLSKGNRKKLRQTNQMGLSFSEASPIEHSRAYQVIRKNRESLGAQVSLSEAELLNLLQKFPENYSCYLLKDDEMRIAATAFLVETSAENVYVYLWADTSGFRHVSPVVRLLVELVSIFKNRYDFLDLGTSAIEGLEIEGLVRFKENLGALRSYKRQIFWKG